jgi:hypothetical protein
MLGGVVTDLKGFEAFYGQRRSRLIDRIVTVLNAPAAAPATAG